VYRRTDPGHGSTRAWTSASTDRHRQVWPRDQAEPDDDPLAGSGTAEPSWRDHLPPQVGLDGPIRHPVGRRRSDRPSGRSADKPTDGRHRGGGRTLPGPIGIAVLVVVLLVAIGGGTALLRAELTGSEAVPDASALSDSDGPGGRDTTTDPDAARTDDPGLAVAELGPATLDSPSPNAVTASPSRARTTQQESTPSRQSDPSLNLPTPAAPTPSTGGGASLEQQVLVIVNRERAGNGCAAVTINDRLSEASQLHSEDQAATNTMSHTGSDGSSPWDRAERVGYERAIGENVAAGYRTPATVMGGWMGSPGHRANILNCDAVAMGLGAAASSNGTLYWTQMFGSAA